VVTCEAAQVLNEQQAQVVDLEERTWLPRHHRGDPQAFAILLNAYQRPVYSFLLRCGVAETARDDLFQDIFFKIHKAAASYQSSQPLKPWLFTIAANTVRNYFRDQRSLTSTLSDTEAQIPDPQASQERIVDAQHTIHWLEHMISNLPLNQRQVLLLTTIEGLRQQEVSDVLQLPVNSVKTYLRRARLSLSKALQQREQQRDDHGTL